VNAADGDNITIRSNGHGALVGRGTERDRALEGVSSCQYSGAGGGSEVTQPFSSPADGAGSEPDLGSGANAVPYLKAFAMFGASVQ